MASHRVRATLTALLILALLPWGLASLPLVSSPEALPPISAQTVVVMPPSMDQAGEYRFVAPDASAAALPWLSFAEPLELSAILGEERTYVLEFRQGGGPWSRRTVVIDRRPPGQPVASQPSGLYRSELRLGLTARDSTEIRYSVAPVQDGDEPVFAAYDPAKGIEIGLPAEGAKTWRLLAYGLDRAGNPGPLLSQVYRLAPAGLDYSPPVTFEAGAFGVDALAELGDPQEIRLDSGLKLIFSPPEGRNLLVAVNPAGATPNREDFVSPGGQGGASLDFAWPTGWKGRARVFLGLEKDGKLAYRAKPLELSLGGQALVLPPPAPVISSETSGGRVLLAYPPYNGEIYVSVDASPFALTKAPLSLGGTVGQVQLAWYGLDYLGRKSAVQTLALDLPGPPAKTSLVGLPEGGLSPKPILLQGSGPGFLRYELSTDPALPPREPTASSSTIGQGLKLDPPEGSLTAYSLRYRSFDSTGRALDEGGQASFVIDRDPPPPPRLATEVPGYSSRSLSLSFVPSDATVMVAVDVDARPGSYSPVDGPLSLEGSPSGTVEYRIHSYAVDKAGNRSTDSPIKAILVDLGTLYVAEGGPVDGDGSRDFPFPSLDKALGSLAPAPGPAQSKTLHLRGTLALSSPLVLEGYNLAIEGGYDNDWKRSPGLSSALHISSGDGPTPMLALKSSSLSLASVSLRAPRLEGPLFDLQASELRISSSSILASTGGDLLLFDIRDSRLSLGATEVLVGEGGSVSILGARNSRIELENSSFTGSGSTYFSALSLDGGSLGVKACSLSSTALLGTRLMEVRNAAVDIDGASLDVQGGGGFLSFGSFEACLGRLANSHLLLSWEGSGSLFRIKGGKMAFLQDSFYCLTRKGSLRFFDAEGPNLVLRNSIFSAKGEANVLITSPGLPAPGDVASNCLWGFKTLVSGPRSLIDTRALNEHNDKATAGPGLPNFLEDPFLTWGPNPPGAFILQASSRCLDSGMALPDLGRDFGDQKRPSGSGFDLGADEFQH